MIWILATRGASTITRDAFKTVTNIDGVHSVIYRPGVEPVPCDGSAACQLGEFQRGLNRVSGILFSYHGSVAEELLSINDSIDLVIFYRANGEQRKRTIEQVIFMGDATVTFPSLNTGVSVLIGVPFRVQLKEGDTLASRIADVSDP